MYSPAAYDEYSSASHHNKTCAAYFPSKKDHSFGIHEISYKHGKYIVALPDGSYDNIEHVSSDGAFGVIFQAFSHLTNTRVVIKKQSLESSADCEASARELSVLSHLSQMPQHPNIISLLDAWEYNDCLYLVSPLRKCSLDDFIQSNIKEIRPQERMYIFKQILSGTQHLHCSNILHRDLKPGNIVVSEGLHVELIDFGASRLFRAKAPQTKGKYVCTYPYRPPEADVGLYFKSSDIWSLGCILVELITGERMFDGEEELLAFDRLQIEKRLTSIQPEATAFEFMLLQNIFKLDPENRWSSAQLLSAIDEHPKHHFQTDGCFTHEVESISYQPPQYTYDNLPSIRQSITCLLSKVDASGY